MSTVAPEIVILGPEIVIPVGVRAIRLPLLWSVMPAGVRARLLSPTCRVIVVGETTWTPAGESTTVWCAPGGTGAGGDGIASGGVGPDCKVRAGGSSANTIWLPASVRRARTPGAGDGSGGGAVAPHRQPRT